MDESPDVPLSLERLSEITGIERRAIRMYIAEGLLRGPSKRGRYAAYSEQHLERLLAIRTLKEQGLSLSRIRQQLLSMSEDEIAALGRTTRPGTRAPQTSGSALDYIRSIQAVSPSAASPAPQSPTGLGTTPRSFMRPAAPAPLPGAKGSPVDDLLLELGKLFEQRAVPRRAEGEAWFRISITPDFELAVRGLQTADQLARLERIADYLREILLGGLKE